MEERKKEKDWTDANFPGYKCHQRKRAFGGLSQAQLIEIYERSLNTNITHFHFVSPMTHFRDSDELCIGR